MCRILPIYPENCHSTNFPRFKEYSVLGWNKGGIKGKGGGVRCLPKLKCYDNLTHKYIDQLYGWLFNMLILEMFNNSLQAVYTKQGMQLGLNILLYFYLYFKAAFESQTNKANINGVRYLNIWIRILSSVHFLVATLNGGWVEIKDSYIVV